MAILGGSFDPIHNGHIYLAKHIMGNLPVCGVRIIPNGEPPHKSACIASWEDRLRMCKLAVAHLPQVQVGADEPPGRPHYTVKTLQRLGSRLPFSLALLVGTDAFSEIHHWYRWRNIFSLASVIVASRKNVNTAVAAQVSVFCRHRRTHRQAPLRVGKAYHWHADAPALSATEVRNKLATGKIPADDILPVSVSEYIKQKKLYGKNR